MMKETFSKPSQNKQMKTENPQPSPGCCLKSQSLYRATHQSFAINDRQQ